MIVRGENYQMLTHVPLLLKLIPIRHKYCPSIVGNESNSVCTHPERVYVPHSPCRVLHRFHSRMGRRCFWQTPMIMPHGTEMWSHSPGFILWFFSRSWILLQKCRLCWGEKALLPLWRKGNTAYISTLSMPLFWFSIRLLNKCENCAIATRYK